MRAPLISVVIPTYNRSGLLRHTLRSLADQHLPAADFEVIVADDGSNDNTVDVVRSFGASFRVHYYFQPDQGFRAARARNEGARIAAGPILAFLDTGVQVGPDWLGSHLRAHAGAALPGRAVLGYVFGYNPGHPCPGLAELVGTLPPEQIVANLAGQPSFQDLRHAGFAQVDYDLTRLAAPWFEFFALNVSVPARTFWAVGGFDEDFQGWGVEDLELGYRLSRHDVAMTASRQAWGIEAPHHRDVAGNLRSNRRNIERFIDKHRGPVAELYWAISSRRLPYGLEDECQALLAWQRKAASLDVLPELAASELPAGGGDPPRVAVFGCGGALPLAWLSSTATFALCDFDEDLLMRTVPEPGVAGGRFQRLHTACLRTPLPDASYDVVVVTSRLAGLWDRWGADVLREARRIGREVRVTEG